MQYICFIFAFSSLLPAGLQGQTQRVYIAPDDHTDYFWTADDDQYRDAFLNTLDYYLDRADDTDENPPEFQSRWNCDGHLWLWTYEKYRTQQQFQRLIDRIADGHISVPLNPLCVCLGATPAEAVIRGMYYPGRIERQHGLRFRMANAIENQTQPLGLASLWAGAGAKYTWKGICGCDSHVPNAGDREHEIYRARGLDGAELLMKWNSMLSGNENMGGYAEARNPSAVVNYVTTNAPFNGFAARYPYDVIGCFGHGWDDFQTQTNQFVTVAQTMSNASRQVIVSNELDFFADFEASHNVAALPAKTVSFGNEWELYCAGMAETSARVKRSLEKLRAAEAMAAVVSLFDADFMSGRETISELAFLNMGLFYEHDFGMVGPQTGAAGVQKRIDWQHEIATQIESYVDSLHDDARQALGTLIPLPGSHPRFFVFNPLSWPRDDVADFAYAGPTPVHVIDVATQDETPSQIISIDGQAHLRVLARGVPSFGYRVFEIRPGSGQTFADAATVEDEADLKIIENDRYRVGVAPRGAIVSLIDKARGNREFVQSISGRMMNDLGISTGTIVLEDAGPASVTLKALAGSPVAHVTRVTLYHDIDRIDIHNEITENFESTRTYAFGFNLANPIVRHEEVGAILQAKLSTAGGDYSHRNARYDWLTLNHFADITGDGTVGLTLSNADAYFFKLGASTIGALDTTTPSITVLAGGNVANGSHGLPNQGGDDHFTHRFALKTHDAYDPVAAMKMALSHQNPLVCGAISGATVRLPAAEFSAVTLSNQSAVLWAFKPAESPGAGLVARLWNLSDSPQTAGIQLFPRNVNAAKIISHIETDEADLPVEPEGISAGFTRQQMKSFRLLSRRCGDFDGDGDQDESDIASFTSVLLDPDADPALSTMADMNADQSTDGRDLTIFVNCLLDQN
ncbi:MAG TPA: glycoside hydrolase [Phycisphaerae bacterium]|nr:glycoside hydrolase [Phycisphaerae bacterium]